MTVQAPGPLRAFSFGGGVQSTAALVLASKGEIDFPLFIFANVGEDSENPRTLAYIEEHTKPFAAAHGIELIELRKRVNGTGPEQTLLQHLERSKTSIPIPVRMANGAPGNRRCTHHFKIRVIGRELRRRGASPKHPATVGLGISLDEFQRANESRLKSQINVYPLLDLRLDRRDCLQIVSDAGLPPPPKSACYFCPFHPPAQWQRLRREDPDLFKKAAGIEAMLNEKRAALGKDKVWLTKFAGPLNDVIPDQLSLVDDGDSCESGYCMT